MDLKLEIDSVFLSFGGVHALKDLSIEVRQGEILGIIGPNGAGKTCLLNCINGFYRPDKGRIIFDKQEITKLPSHKIAALGLARTFQNAELYSGLSVLENILAGRHSFIKHGFLADAIHFGPARNEEVKQWEIAEDIIDLLEIEPIRKKVVGTLAYGLRKRVELGRALALEPKVLLLDEPMAGMNLDEKEDLARFILDIYEERCDTIVLIEHDMGVVMDISDRIVVLDLGHKIAEGSPEEISVNPEVIKAYLGKEVAR